MSTKNKFHINPKEAEPVRIITTHEGRFLNFDDIIARMRDDAVVDGCLAVMKVGHDRGDDPRQAVRMAILSLILQCAGEKIGEDERPNR